MCWSRPKLLLKRNSTVNRQSSSERGEPEQSAVARGAQACTKSAVSHSCYTLVCTDSHTILHRHIFTRSLSQSGVESFCASGMTIGSPNLHKVCRLRGFLHACICVADPSRSWAPRATTKSDLLVGEVRGEQLQDECIGNAYRSPTSLVCNLRGLLVCLHMWNGSQQTVDTKLHLIVGEVRGEELQCINNSNGSLNLLEVCNLRGLHACMCEMNHNEKWTSPDRWGSQGRGAPVHRQ